MILSYVMTTPVVNTVGPHVDEAAVRASGEPKTRRLFSQSASGARERKCATHEARSTIRARGNIVYNLYRLYIFT